MSQGCSGLCSVMSGLRGVASGLMLLLLFLFKNGLVARTANVRTTVGQSTPQKKEESARIGQMLHGMDTQLQSKSLYLSGD